MVRRILFLCVHNSSRSQMAEGFARRLLAGPGCEVASAGSEPRGVNPYAVRAMAEKGIDISGHTSKRLDAAPAPALVVTLCAKSEESCPVYPPAVEVEHWGLPDPSLAPGSDEEKLRVFRRVRDEIERRVVDLAARLARPDRLRDPSAPAEGT